MLHSLAKLPNQESVDALQTFLDIGALPELEGEWASKPGLIEGPLCGGNLCMLTTLMGTPWQPQLDGSILMLEEIGEPAYKIQRMLSQLRYSGILDNIKAIGFGSFTSCPFPSSLTLEKLILEFSQKIKVPILVNLPFGHGRSNKIWNLGRHYQINLDGSMTPVSD